MSLLNADNYPYILTWNWDDLNTPNPNENKIEYRNNSLLFHIRDWTDKDYFYIEFLHGDAFVYYPINTLMDDNTFTKLKQGEITLALCNSHECYHTVVQWIFKEVIKKHDIPSKNVLLITESADISREIIYVSTKLDLEPFLHETVFEFEKSSQWDAEANKIKPKTLEFKTYDKKFLSFNGFYRPHRASLLLMLYAKNLENKGYLSYNSSSILKPTPEESIYFLSEMGQSSSEFLELIEKGKEKFLNTDIIRLDDPNWNAKYSIDNQVYQFYENTYFSVITETNCTLRSLTNYFLTWGGDTGVGRVISEKTFRTIGLKHPFILLAVPKTLELLRSLGYKTFNPFIDESYDDEFDDAKRFVKIIDEIEKLCNLNHQQLEEFLINCKSICDYNYNVLLSKKKFNHVIPLERTYWL